MFGSRTNQTMPSSKDQTSRDNKQASVQISRNPILFSVSAMDA